MKVLAVDPSLTCSGWALFSTTYALGSEPQLLGVGKVKSESARTPLPWRLSRLQEKIQKLLVRIGLCDDDIVVCESPTTVIDPSAAFKVEQVRCMFEVLARARGIEVPGRINPRSIHRKMLGMKGAQLAREFVKQSAVHHVSLLFRSQLESLGFVVDEAHLKKNQDIVDAVLLGSYAVTCVSEAQRASLPLEEFFE